MLLAADVGNTEIVLGVFGDPEADDAGLLHTWRLSTQPERTADELALHLDGFLASRGIGLASDVTGFVIASVVPDVTAALREMAGRYLTSRPSSSGRGPRRGFRSSPTIRARSAPIAS